MSELVKGGYLCKLDEWEHTFNYTLFWQVWLGCWSGIPYTNYLYAVL